jgi:hypothetical protein
MMQTTDIIQDISRLPVSQRMVIVEYIIRSIRYEEQQPLEKAATCLYADYLNDKELTIFTQLDCEDFYETR